MERLAAASEALQGRHPGFCLYRIVSQEAEERLQGLGIQCQLKGSVAMPGPPLAGDVRGIQHGTLAAVAGVHNPDNEPAPPTGVGVCHSE